MNEAVLNAAFDSVITIDEQGRVVDLNRAAEELFGFSRSVALGGSLAEMIIPLGLRPACSSGLQRVLSGGPSNLVGHRTQLPGLRADGSQILVELTVIRTQQAPPRFTAWLRDHSGRQKADEGLARRQAVLSWAERLAQMGSWDWMLATGEMQWSDNLFQLYGLTAGGAPPTLQLVFDMTHPEDRERLERAVATAEREGALPPLDYRIVRADGAVRHLRATLAVAEEGDRRPERLVGSVQDVTERRRAEREIEAHLAIDDVLSKWDTLEQGAKLLLRGLAQAMDFDAGVFWLPQKNVLAPKVFWRSDTLDADVFESATKPLRLPADQHVPAQAWENLEPAVWIASPCGEEHPRRQAAVRAGLSSAIAFPAIGTEDVMAVVELFSREEIDTTRRLTRSLSGIGHELGRFLEGRRGELGPKLLTPREIQVLQLAANGSSGRQIAAELVVSPATVKSHFENMYTKLRVSDRAAAVAVGLRQGFID
jgi:PAS domain S-box-containing protein